MERVSRQVQAYKQVHGFGFNLDWELCTIEMQDDTVQNRNPKSQIYVVPTRPQDKFR